MIVASVNISVAMMDELKNELNDVCIDSGLAIFILDFYLSCDVFTQTRYMTVIGSIGVVTDTVVNIRAGITVIAL